MKVATYLEFKQNSKEVIETYKEIFNARVISEYYFDENMTKDKSLLGKVFHAELQIGDLNLYIADTNVEPSLTGMKFVAEISDEAEARACFEKLIHTGKLISDFVKMPYGPKIAGAMDKFGIKWEIVVC